MSSLAPPIGPMSRSWCLLFCPTAPIIATMSWISKLNPFGGKPSLLSRLPAALVAGKDLSDELKVGDEREKEIGPADAADICTFLAEQTDVGPLLQGSTFITPLYHLVMCFQAEMEEETRDYMREHGLPELLRLCDLGLGEPGNGGPSR